MTIMSKKYLQPDPKKIEIFSIDCDSESDDAEEEEDAESIAQRDIGRWAECGCAVGWRAFSLVSRTLLFAPHSRAWGDR